MVIPAILVALELESLKEEKCLYKENLNSDEKKTEIGGFYAFLSDSIKIHHFTIFMIVVMIRLC